MYLALSIYINICTFVCDVFIHMDVFVCDECATYVHTYHTYILLDICMYVCLSSAGSK